MKRPYNIAPITRARRARVCYPYTTYPTDSCTLGERSKLFAAGLHADDQSRLMSTMPSRKRYVIPAAGMLAAAGIYAMLTLFFFDLELRATLVAKRADDLPPWLLPARRQEPSSETRAWAGNATTTSRPTKLNTDREGVRSSHSSRLDGRKTPNYNRSDLDRRTDSLSGSYRRTTTASVEAVSPGGTVGNGGKNECEWVTLKVKGPPYFLTTVFIVRIYEKDLSELTSQDVKHWLLYLRYAGVEHVYLYDLWYLPGESQREEMDIFVREGFLTYFDRHELNPFDIERSQHGPYQHCINHFGKNSQWQMAIDIDEYPFAQGDTEPGFLSRYINKYSKENPSVSEITMSNFVYLGEKDKSRELLFDKLWRRTHVPENNLVKPIYKPAAVLKAIVHHNNLRKGDSRTAPSRELRMNHYWGARLQNWGPDTEEILAKTEEDRGMEPIVASFKTCKRYIQFYLS